MREISLRRRIALGFALLSICSLIALAASLLISAEEYEEELIDEVVNTALHQIEAQWPVTGSLVLPRNFTFYHAPLGMKPAGLPVPITRFAVGNAEYFVDGREYHVGVREHDGERLYVLYDTEEHERRLGNIYLGASLAVVLLSILAGLAGHFLAASILRQLSALTLAVENDQSPALSQIQDREVRVLSRAISDAREQTAQLLQREREFTAHVGHELRTPLTRIATSAELLRELSDLPEADMQRLRQIELDAADMQARLTALLFLARELHAMHLADVDLHATVEQSLLHLAGQKPQIARQNRVETGLIIQADPQLLQMLIDNLLGNALRYTQEGQIIIGWQAGVLYVADSGEGIAKSDILRLQQPFERASSLPDGFGLGLAIVSRICEAHGWHWTIDSQAGQGTRITIQMLPDSGLPPHKTLTKT
ncbi:sensor histidine kinase [Chitinibacter sp. S2-10]|uniref:sensor histidine kinase n=1 Tax=Chitinibacter sp. S2-10 TaxID=3373597 RepID=UPI00397760BF